MYYYIEYQVFYKPSKKLVFADNITEFLNVLSSRDLEKFKKKLLTENFDSFEHENFYVQIISLTPLPREFDE